jgi:hypothetical protein
MTTISEFNEIVGTSKPIIEMTTLTAAVLAVYVEM